MKICNKYEEKEIIIKYSKALFRLAFEILKLYRTLHQKENKIPIKTENKDAMISISMNLFKKL